MVIYDFLQILDCEVSDRLDFLGMCSRDHGGHKWRWNNMRGAVFVEFFSDEDGAEVFEYDEWSLVRFGCGESSAESWCDLVGGVHE